MRIVAVVAGLFCLSRAFASEWPTPMPADALRVAVLRVSDQSAFTIANASPNAWMTSLDLSVGEPPPYLTADQIYGSFFTIRSEVRRMVINHKEYVDYQWFVRNKSDRVVSIAVMRPQMPTPRAGRVYGATWANVLRAAPLDTSSLYGVHTKDAAGWTAPAKRTPNAPHLSQWLALQPEEEWEIHRTCLPVNGSIEAAFFSIPYQVAGLPGEALLSSVIQ